MPFTCQLIKIVNCRINSISGRVPTLRLRIQFAVSYWRVLIKKALFWFIWSENCTRAHAIRSDIDFSIKLRRNCIDERHFSRLKDVCLTKTVFVVGGKSDHTKSSLNLDWSLSKASVIYWKWQINKFIKISVDWTLKNANWSVATFGGLPSKFSII